MDTKRENRFFNLAEYEEEQSYLEQMHKQGWKLLDYHVFKGYTFERCEPQEWLYRLDYREKMDGIASYTQLFADCGWEYILMVNNFYYFRKRKDGHEQLEIFSDQETRFAYCKSIYRRSLCITVALGVVITICTLNAFRNSLHHEGFTSPITIVSALLLLILLAELVYLIRCTCRLYRKMKQIQVLG